MKILRVLVIFLSFFIIFPSLAKEIPPEPGKRLIIHKVGKGEELHLLAGYYLLNAREWHKIYLWNSGVIKDQNLIHQGQELTIYVDNDWGPPYNLDEYLKKIGRR